MELYNKEKNRGHEERNLGGVCSMGFGVTHVNGHPDKPTLAPGVGRPLHLSRRH